METIEIIGFKPNETDAAKLPLFTMSVSAGTPVPVDNDVESEVDLNEFLVEHPNSTFFARVKGVALSNVGIKDNDILVVDASKDPHDGSIVVATVNNEMTVKIYRQNGDEVFLEGKRGQIIPIRIDSFLEFNVLGTVTKVIRSL